MNEQSQPIISTFEKGMWLDAHTSFQPPGTVPYAKNIISRDEYQNSFRSNEHGTSELVDIDDIIGDVFMKDTNETVFLKKSGELWKYNYDSKELKRIMSFSEFGCEMSIKECEYVKIVYTTKNCDKYVNWSSNNVYYWVNISEMLNPKRKETLLQKLTTGCGDCVNDCNYFKVFRPKKNIIPRIDSHSTGGSLPAGSYVAVGRLINEDGSSTNFCVPSRPVHIGSEHNIPGEESRGRLDVSFENLDCNYNRIEVVIVYYDGSTISARAITDYFSKEEYTFEYIQLAGEPIDIAEILIKSQINLEGDNLEAYDGVMYYFGIKPYKEYNVQKIADNIQVQWVAEKYSYEDARKYNIKTIPYGESLAFGIVINHDDGTHSYVGHIRASGGDGSGYSSSNPQSNLSIEKEYEYKRERKSKEDEVGKIYQEDTLVNTIKNNVDTYQIDSKDINDIVAPACKENGCDNDCIEPFDIKGGHCSGSSGNGSGSDGGSDIDNSPKSKENYDNLFYYTAESCINSDFTTIIGLPNEVSIDTIITVQGECFKITAIDESNTNFYFGENQYVNCPQCILLNGIKETISNPSSNGSGNGSGQGGGGCGGGGGGCSGSGCGGGGSCNCKEGCITCGSSDCKDGNCSFPGTIETTYGADGNIISTTTKEGIEQQSQLVDELNSFCNVRNDQKDANIISKDLPTAEKILVDWASTLADYIGESGRLDLQLQFKPNDLKEAAVEIINAVKRRERITEKKEKYSIKKSSIFRSSNRKFDQIKPTYPFGQIVAIGSTRPKIEARNYPCTRDCDGNMIYGDFVGKPITHHLFPDETEIDYFESGSDNVPSKANPDGNEYEGHGVYLGARFSNIIIDKEDYYRVTGKRVSSYTITQAKLNYSNKTILTKGLITSNYISSNNGKEYDIQRHAVNSYETVNRYIDIDGSRWEQNPRPSDTVRMYSLDQSTLHPAIGSATRLKIVKRLQGWGYRHYLYKEGEQPDNPTFGRRIDQRGCVSATMLGNKQVNSAEYQVTFAKYISGGEKAVEAPGVGGSRAMINNYGQDCLWIGLSSVYDLTDKSFLGDVLHDNNVLSATADYAVLVRDLADQYGSLESISYIPILDVKDTPSSVSGLFGDRFIHPYSYVTTSFVSDRVGNKFPISNRVPGKEDRCICDNPDDSINELIGKFVWTQLPKNADQADAKRWAGTHTPNDEFSRSNGGAYLQNASESEYYYPGTVTHLNTYVGESEANPYMRELGESLEDQVYPYIKPIYHLHAEEGPWKDSYLSQFYIKNPQPSPAERLMKVLMKGIINILIPMFKLEDLLSPDGTLDLAGDILSLPMFFAVWMLLSKVLFTDDFVDEFIGLPKCKTDDEGGIEFKVEKYFKNFDRYSYVFSQKRDLYQYRGIQDFVNCGCEQGTMHNVYVSDKQIETSFIDAFKSVRPNNFFTVNQSEGQLIDMFVATQGGMFIHTTDGILRLEQGRNINTDSIYNILSGSIDIIPRRIIGSTYEGNAGIASRHHAINSKYGRFFLDYEANEFYMFDGNSITPISIESGATTLFKNYTKYCEESDCINNFESSHYTLGIDPRFHRLLITKVDGDKSWTISYDLLNRHFISFHDYIPKKYIFTREDMYALEGGKLHSFKKTPDMNTKYNNYFGEQYGFEIDVKSMSQVTTNYESHIIRTNIEQNNNGKLIKNIPETFDQMYFWSTRQTSGLVHLENYSHVIRENNLDLQDNITLIPVTHINNEFRINELYDYIAQEGEALIEKEDCLPFIKPINYDSGKYRNIQTTQFRVINDNMFFTRLIKSALPDKKMYIKNMLLTHKPKIR